MRVQAATCRRVSLKPSRTVDQQGGRWLQEGPRPSRSSSAPGLRQADTVSLLITITGPIASGKNTVATLLAEPCARSSHTVVVADIDDVAAMVAGPGAAPTGLWFAAHEAHGALVGQWMRSSADLVIAVGPVYTQAEQDALFHPLPSDARVCRVQIDASLAVTWERVRADEGRGLSRQRDFHVAAHDRFRSLLPGIPSDLRFNSNELSAPEIAAAILRASDGGPLGDDSPARQ